MATILIFPFHEAGHLIASLPLAMLLRERGHRVVYMTILDLVPDVEAHRFECVPVLRDVFPGGHFAALERTAPSDLGLMQKIIWMRAGEELFSGRFQAQVDAIAPDLMLIDVINTMHAMAARVSAIPCLLYTVTLSQRIAEVPPVTSDVPFDAPPVQRQAAAATSSYLVKWPWLIYEYALDRFEYPAEDASFAAVYTPELRLVPTLVIPSSAFDFPPTHPSGSVYASLPIDLDRPEHVPPELEHFLDGRPVVYVSLGTQGHRYPAAPALLRAVLLAFRQRPGWQAIVAAGNHASAIALDCPDNVIVLRHAPQLWALRRAAVFITHVGMGAMREAVELGVPMIAIPQGYDQLGNATRVEYHGLGVHLPVDVVDPARLISCIDRVLADRDAYQQRLRRIREACVREYKEGRAIQIIEDQLAKPERERPRAPASSAGSPATGTTELGWLFVPAERAADLEGELPAGTVPSLGRAGFTMCPEIGHALSRAEGNLVVRVEVTGDLERTGPYVTGRALRKLWQLDASAQLSRFAIRCVEHALEAEQVEHPEIAGFFLETFARYRAGSNVRAELERVGAPLTHRGYGVGLQALEASAHDAARFARDTLIMFRCRSRGPDVPPSAARYLRERPDVIRAIDAELLGLITEAAARAGFDMRAS